MCQMRVMDSGGLTLLRIVIITVWATMLGCNGPTAELVCPKGASVQGIAPPFGKRLVCVRVDASIPSGLSRHGPEVRWFSNGQVRSKQSFRMNKLEGLSQTWFPKGSRSFQGEYVNDKREGLWQEYSRDNILRSKTNYRDGTIHGERLFYYPSGQVKSSHTYQFGILDGPAKGFHPNGRRAFVGQYGKNVPQGEWTRFGAKGKSVTRALFVDGVEQNLIR